MIDRLMRLGSVTLLAWVVLAGAVQAQEQFNARSPSTPETFNSGNSQPTGTQGVVGNPFCAPPHEIINGKDVTPLNWSCPTVQQPYVIPKSFTVARPGPVAPPGAANPCQPGGPGGYNFLDNAVGVPLPAGCLRPAAKTATKTPKPTTKTIAKTDSNYESAPPGMYLQPPTAPPGSYIQPDPKPGDYLEPDGSPGSYIDSTARSGPGTVTQISPNGAIELTPGTGNQSNETQPAGATPYRPNNQALQGGVSGEQPMRQDTGAMQFPGNLFGLIPSGPSQTMSQAGTPAQSAPAAKTTTKKTTTASNTKKPATTNATGMTPAQAAQLMNAFVHMAGSSP